MKIIFITLLLSLMATPTLAANGYEQKIDCTDKEWASQLVTGLLVQGIKASSNSLTLKVLPTMFDDKCTPKLGTVQTPKKLKQIELYYGDKPNPKSSGQKVVINANGDGQTEVTLTGLQPVTKYYFDACMIAEDDTKACAIHPSSSYNSAKTFATSSPPLTDLKYVGKSGSGGEQITFQYAKEVKDKKGAKASIQYFNEKGEVLASALAASSTTRYGIPSQKVSDGGYLVVDLIAHAGYYYQGKINHRRFGSHTTKAFQISQGTVKKEVPIDTSKCIGESPNCVKEAIVTTLAK